jgi:hypothetical protein
MSHQQLNILHHCLLVISRTLTNLVDQQMLDAIEFAIFTKFEQLKISNFRKT